MKTKSGLLGELSGAIATLASDGAAGVVRVDGRRRRPASGIAWGEGGLVVAPHHAVEWDDEVEVGLPGGETVPAELVGRDATTDVALLRARGAELSAPRFEAEPISGQLVVGITRPGRAHRVALGVVSRVAGEWRTPAGGRIERYVETTLPWVPGMSGSLVLDADGAALGMATAGLLRGRAMVVPSATLRRVVAALLAHGHVPRGYLGLATFPVRLPAEAAKVAGAPGALLVTAVVEGSPAAAAGLLLGDAIVTFGGEPVADPHALLAQLEPERIGATVPVRVLRAGAAMELTLTVGSRPRGEGP